MPSKQSARELRFSRWAWLALAYTVLVILWGAVVRATGSGAGCGAHWPLCNGEVIPTPESTKTIVEFAHRVTSGLSLIVVFALAWAARKTFPEGHFTRKASRLAVVAIILEALLGAGLVLLELVEHDKSVARAISISLHLVNTSFLTGTLVAVAASAQASAQGLTPHFLPRTLVLRQRLQVAIATFLLLGAAGAITALGDTLFRVETLAEGIAMDTSPGAHFLLRLRIVHPILAIGWAVAVIAWMLGMERVRAAKDTAAWVAMNLVFGAMNLVMMAPTWMQVGHLLLANMIWISLIRTSLEIATVEAGK